MCRRPSVKTMLADAEPPRRLATVVVIGKLNQGVNLRFRCNKRANENRYVFAFGGRIHATPISVLEVMTYRIFLAGTVGPFDKFVDLRLGQIIVREDGGEHPLMHGGDEWTAGDFAVVGVCVIASLEQRFVEGEQFVIVGNLEHLERLASANGRFLRHRFLTEGNKRRNTGQFTQKKRVAKEAVSTALQTNS